MRSKRFIAVLRMTTPTLFRPGLREPGPYVFGHRGEARIFSKSQWPSIQASMPAQTLVDTPASVASASSISASEDLAQATCNAGSRFPDRRVVPRYL